MPHHHCTPNEQYVIAHMTIAGFSEREIGRRLGRHHTSIGCHISFLIEQSFARTDIVVSGRRQNSERNPQQVRNRRPP
jgi:IS30 family transposase